MRVYRKPKHVEIKDSLALLNGRDGTVYCCTVCGDEYMVAKPYTKEALRECQRQFYKLHAHPKYLL